MERKTCGRCAVEWNDRIRRPVENHRRHRPLGRVFRPRHKIRAAHRANGGNALGQSAGQQKRHPSAVGQAVGVNARLVNVVVLFQLVNEIRNELHILPGFFRLVETAIAAPPQRETSAKRINHQKTGFIRQPVPVAQPHQVRGPLGKTVQVDDQWCGTVGVICLGHVQQVGPLLTTGQHRTVAAVEFAIAQGGENSDRVKNYAKWKKVFDECAAKRRAAGETAYLVGHVPGKPNNVCLVVQYDTAANAAKFVKSKDIKAAMQSAGVIEQPDVFIIEEKEKVKT